MTVPPKVVLDKVAYVVPFRSGQQGERHAAVVVNIANSDASLQPGTPVMLTIGTKMTRTDSRQQIADSRRRKVAIVCYLLSVICCLAGNAQTFDQLLAPRETLIARRT